MFKTRKNKKSREEEKTGEGIMSTENSIDTDPLGMWTGVPDDPYELPVQDADDL